MFERTNYSQIQFLRTTKTMTSSLFKNLLGPLYDKFPVPHLKETKTLLEHLTTHLEHYSLET